MKTDAVNSCYGPVFCAIVSQHYKNDTLHLSVKLKRDRKIGCPGCEHCNWVDDAMAEISNDWPLLNLGNAIGGELYRVEIANEHLDSETGCVDSWDLQLCELLTGEPA